MTELVFILDRSGSMAGLEEDTIGGFNSVPCFLLIGIAFFCTTGIARGFHLDKKTAASF